MEGTNSFEKGLHRSNSPQMQPEGSYVDAYNWIRNDSGRLTNEELESITKTLEDAASYTYLGSCPIQDSFIIFFQQLGNDGNKYSEIGLFQNGVYERVFNDYFHSYKLNFVNNIDSVARIVSTVTNAETSPEGDRIVYFVEKDNVPRRFNIDQYLDDNTTYSQINDFRLQLDLVLPEVGINITTGGNLPSGVYSIVCRYRTTENNKTSFGIPTKFYSIIDDNGTSENADGCPPGTQTNKNIYITLNQTDLNYPYIEPVVITYEGITNVLVIKSLGVYSNEANKVIIFSDESQYQDSVPLTEITDNPIFYESAECIEQKDNILVLSNLTTKKYDRDFQEIANAIDMVYSIDVKYPDTLRKNFLTFNTDYATGYEPDSNIDTADNPNTLYKNNELKGFQRGEVYSFSFTPIYKDGSLGFSYHIPGKEAKNATYVIGVPTITNKRRLHYYESQEEYPEYLASSGLTGYIRHHLVPDTFEVNNTAGFTVPPIVENTDENANYVTKVNILKVSAVVGGPDFTDAQKAKLQDLQGYIIGYQQRNSEFKKRIIDYGLVKPYIANDTNYKQSFLNGNGVFYFDNNASMTSVFQPPKGYLMYYSADGLLDNYTNINTSYNIEKVGYVQNSIKYETGAGVLSEELSANFIRKGGNYSAVFFDGKRIITNKEISLKISKAIPVDNLGGATNGTKIDGKFEIGETYKYLHIETPESIWQTYGGVVPAFAINKEGGNSYIGTGATSNTNPMTMTLARIINPLTNLYGRLENAEYCPAAVIYNNTAPSNTYIRDIEGDIFITQYWQVIRDTIQDNYRGFDDYVSSEDYHSAELLIGIYVESKNNYSLRHTDTLEVPYYPKFKTLFTNSASNLGLLNFEWYKRTLGYNKQYSAENNIKKTFIKPLFFKENSYYPNRSIYSSQSFETELADQYRIFPYTQFHDIPRHRGIIKDTFVFNNNFFHHTEYGLWLSYFNPNTTQATSQGQVVLGNAGVFQLPSKLILDIKGGYMGTLDKSGTNTPFGRVFLDHKQGKVFLFAGDAPVEISDLGLFSFFRGFVNTEDKYCMGYDWANKRLLLNNITQGKAISFYPKTQTWTSLHDFSPNAYFTINGSSYAWRNNENSFYNMDNEFGIRKNSYITFVENTQPDAFKRFDRIEMNTMSGGNQGVNSPGFVEPTSYIFNDESFSTIHCWTDRQNSTELPFAYSHDFESNFLNNYDATKVPTNYYRSSFHAELPLDAVIDPYTNIFETSNLDINADFRAHMKGKFLYTKLSYNQDKPLVLNYIKTFFKPSVA